MKQEARCRDLRVGLSRDAKGGAGIRYDISSRHTTERQDLLITTDQVEKLDIQGINPRDFAKEQSTITCLYCGEE
jgi:hypothetical protein